MYHYVYIDTLNPIESYSDKIGTPQNPFNRNGFAKMVHPKWRITPLSTRLVNGLQAIYIWTDRTYGTYKAWFPTTY